jgi:acyl carrier protein
LLFTIAADNLEHHFKRKRRPVRKARAHAPRGGTMINTIRRLIQENGRLHTPVESLSDSADLYQAGLTPFAAIRTMLALEEAFDVEFPVDMLRRQSFSSINAIVACLNELNPAAVARKAA